MTMDEIRARLVTLIRDECADDDPASNPEDLLAQLREESIQMLALGFRCDREFGIRVDFPRLFDSSLLQTSADGRIPQSGLEALRRTYPFFAVDQLVPPVTQEQLKQLLTIDALAGLIHFLRGQAGGAMSTATTASGLPG